MQPFLRKNAIIKSLKIKAESWRSEKVKFLKDSVKSTCDFAVFMDCFVNPCGFPRKDGRMADCFTL